MRRVFGGAALVIAGVAAFIEAHAHHPAKAVYVEQAREAAGEGLNDWGPHAGEVSAALSHTAYDLLRVGAWALVIVGALLIVVGLMDRWRAPHESTP